MWTLDELVDRVGRALAAEYAGAPNGRVRDVPDRRAIRWYQTIGLIDRPSGMSGRSALYGPRHLLQLVAVKRRQAAGRTIAQIQAELTGADDEVLADVARVPAELLITEGPEPPVVDRPRFWGARTAAAPVEISVPRIAVTVDMSPTEIGGMRLGGGAILVLPRVPTAEDRDAISVAAAPLLALLADRGLLDDADDEAKEARLP